jgi:hypothetical protein
MGYRVLAEIVIVLHLLFICFVVLGGLLTIRWRRMIWFHLPAVVWGVAIEWSGFICPLTPLENWLRVQGGAAGYSTGFVAHYLLPVLYPGQLTRSIQIWLGIGVVVINVAIYGTFLVRRYSSSKPACNRG